MAASQTKALLLASLLAALMNACDAAEPSQEIAPGVRLLAYIRDPRIKESSGVVASRRYADVFWTHNDGGGPKKQVLYAIDREGNTRASFPVIGVTLRDWEDIAIDDAGHLYIGDIGNNDSKRDALAVYEIDEPNPQAGAGRISPKLVWNLRFPRAPFDCESLFVWKDDGYVVSKVFNSACAQIFRFPLKETNRPLTLELVATTKIKSPVTGADISVDGTLLGLVAKDGAYVFRIDGDVTRVSNARPHHTKLKNQHIEGCCFVPEGLLVTSERRMIFLFTDPAFRRQSGSNALHTRLRQRRLLFVAHLLFSSSLLFGRHLFRADLHRQLVQLAGERERRSIVLLQLWWHACRVRSASKKQRRLR